MIKITKDINEAKLVTHSATFHPDDVFSTMLLSKIYPGYKVIRVNKIDDNVHDKIIYDIGFGKYDHHQVDAKLRNEELKYSSFGLLWKDYGKKYLESINSYSEELFNRIDKRLVMQIDGIDNGVFPNIEAPYELLDLDKIIDLFNNNWDSKIDNDNNFIEAVNIASIIFDKLVLREKSLVEAKKEVLEILKNTKDNILLLDKHIPYLDAVFDNNYDKKIDAVIFPSNRGGYNIKPLTISKESFELKKNFPNNWWGLHDKELADITGIKTARFIHANGFIAATDTLEDAYLLVNKLK